LGEVGGPQALATSGAFITHWSERRGPTGGGSPAKQQYRSPSTTKKPVVEGPQTALVVGPEENEIFTDEYGRVKLKFHWDPDPKADASSSCYVRVAQAWAGGGWGSSHIPNPHLRSRRLHASLPGIGRPPQTKQVWRPIARRELCSPRWSVGQSTTDERYVHAPREPSADDARQAS